jgi:pyruvate/2-oxoglutarate/acetoin dehydrogenase E1 component
MMRKITFSQALNEALQEEMRRDGSVIVLGEDINLPWGGIFRVTAGLVEEFGPKRVRTTPISESAIAGGAVGAALVGCRPVAEIMYVDFMPIAMDQIVNQAAKARYMSGGQVGVPVVFRTQEGGGRSSAAQHSQSLEAWFVHVPGLKVVSPSTPYDAKGLLKSAIRDDNPVIFIEHKLLYFTSGEVPTEEYTVPLKEAAIRREGEDITIISYSHTVFKCLEAAQRLEAAGISAEVIDLRTLSPLDMDTVLDSVRKTHRLLVAHEACVTGGFGGEIAARVAEQAFDELDAPVGRVGALDSPIPYNAALERTVIPTPDRIASAALTILRKDE